MIADFISLKRMNYVFIAKTLKTEGLFLLLGELFIEGACDRFLLSDFPVLEQNRFTWMESRWESLLS
jgi:hypothetical protein